MHIELLYNYINCLFTFVYHSYHTLLPSWCNRPPHQHRSLRLWYTKKNNSSRGSGNKWHTKICSFKFHQGDNFFEEPRKTAFQNQNVFCFLQCLCLIYKYICSRLNCHDLCHKSSSLQEFVKDSGIYSKKIVDDLLDQITGGDHSKIIYQLKQVGLHYAEMQLTQLVWDQ